MEVREAVRARRMVRRYTDEPVGSDDLDAVLDAARRGPSAGFSQGQTFVVVTDQRARVELARIAGEAAYTARGFAPWVSSAPVLIVPCAEPGRYAARYAEDDKASSGGPDAWRVPYWWVDTGAALALLQLAAVDRGLATGLLDVVDHDALRALLGIPDDVLPLGLVTLGHPAADRASGSLARGRRPWPDVVRRDRWQRD